MGRYRKEGEMNPIEAEMKRLIYLNSLVPRDEDFDRYGLSDMQLLANDTYWNILKRHKVDCRYHIDLIVTMLRKRRFEQPRQNLSLDDLFDVVRRLTGENQLTKAILVNLEEHGVITISSAHKVVLRI